MLIFVNKNSLLKRTFVIFLMLPVFNPVNTFASFPGIGINLLNSNNNPALGNVDDNNDNRNNNNNHQFFSLTPGINQANTFTSSPSIEINNLDNNNNPLPFSTMNIDELKSILNTLCSINNLNNNNSEPPKKSKKDIYGKGPEANNIKEKLGDFDVYHSRAYETVINNFGRSVRLNELLGIINSIRQYAFLKNHQGIPALNRDEKRSFSLLIKYIETNYDLIVPYFPFVKLCDSNGKPIELDLPS